MSWKAKYDVEFKGLKEGLHEFEFEVQDKFFEHFDQELANSGIVKIIVELEKRSSFMKLLFKINGWIELDCDRCLEKYRQSIENRAEVFVKFGENEYEDSEIIWLLPGEHSINLAQLIYEYIVLSIPIRHIHPDIEGENGCDPAMLEELKKYVIKEEIKKTADPRWAALKNWDNN